MFDRFTARYLLPNAVTGASIVLALVAIVQASRGSYESAAWLIVWCALLDRVDGVVARLARACSDFGLQFDTLADLLAFCAAPALLVYFLLTHDPRYAPVFEVDPGRVVLVMTVGIYVLSGAVRLARFNVQTRRIGPNWSRGLPVPIAAGVVSTLILAAWELSLPASVVAASPIVLVLCGTLMISRLWLPKSLGTANRTLRALQALGVAVIYGFGLLRMLPTFLLAGALAYITFGLVLGRLHPPTLPESET